MTFDVPGFRVGHTTLSEALTGCTVVLCPPRTVGGCDIRGSSPATRETALLSSEKSMQEVHAVLLAGGSAFGLAAADGVMRYLEEQGIGYETPWIRVPIVPAAAIFDLSIGDSAVRPRPEDGYRACLDAKESAGLQGNCGAGTGATVGKWAGILSRMKSGLGCATMIRSGIHVAALAVVNAVGDVVAREGTVIAGARGGDGRFLGEQDTFRPFARSKPPGGANTTLVIIATNAKLQKVDVNRVAQRGHDGMARAVIPVHTSYDGDLVIALSSGIVDAQFDLVAEMGAAMTANAIRNAVRAAASVPGAPGVMT